MESIKKIYILHGWAYSVDKWKPFIKLLNNNGIQIEQLKVPGLTQETDKIWDLDQYVSWLKHIVDKEDEKIILLGHSNGGRIALAYIAKYPEKISQLILIDSAGVYHNEFPIRLKRYIFRIISKIGKKIPHSEKFRNLLYKTAQANDYKEASQSMKQTMLNLITTDLTPVLDRISTPTTIIWGENDKITPVSDGQLIHKLIKNSKLIIIKSAKHSPQFTNPNEVLNEMSKTL